MEDTPLFVAIGFDDNPASTGMTWSIDMLGQYGVKATYFHTTFHAPDALAQWKSALDVGHEAALHNVNHNTGTSTTMGVWQSEVSGSTSTLSAAYGSGGLGAQIFGYRAPSLAFNDALFGVLLQEGVWYDSSIEEGYDSIHNDGTNHYYPYTLDTGSPGHAFNKEYGFPKYQFELSARPGLMELPVYALIVPPDSEATTYGFTTGLRGRIGIPDFVQTGHKVTGFDYNLMNLAGVQPSEFLAILKYNLDLRLQGNRAPLIFGAHTNDFSNSPERRGALSDFIAYAKEKSEVRVVSYKEVFDFMREPKALSCY